MFGLFSLAAKPRPLTQADSGDLSPPIRPTPVSVKDRQVAVHFAVAGQATTRIRVRPLPDKRVPQPAPSP
ncbi:hypothetical protein [Chitinimonas sp. BJYL2]|uniref:hypothetical protein n=1 Tax=Chitinimonas sp. BJYL2 TaxID=2976696 RepID=UPI0022B2DA72|nr:hypothetical protein [Chitinimonas sp. BJYL2]